MHWEHELTRSNPPLSLMIQVASMPFGLVSTQALLISLSTRPAKPPFFQKATSVVVIVEFARIRDYAEWREGTYARDEYSSNTPSSHLSKSSVQKGGAYFWELTVTCTSA